ncbi:MAG: hypothetical protein HXS40_08305 [Theionarchaea archaeon]|nr:hypothetical protein [Theionarchaea archaeon]
MITSRAQLHNLLEKTIDRNSRSMSERGEYADYAVKTNIIEANCRVEEIPVSFSGYGIELKPTKDKFLHVMAVKGKGKGFSLYLDSFFPRFWKLYSIEESLIITRFIGRFIHSLLKIDSLWMPHQMLTAFEDKYTSIGFSIKFKQEVLSEEELSEEDIFQLTMRLWSKGSRPSREIIHLLHEHGYPVTKTSTRLLHVEENEMKFVDEVYYDGKVTINRGTDIEEHIRFVNSVIDTYQEKLTRIEENRMDVHVVREGLKSSGHPFELRFSRNQDTRTLAEKLVNSTNPFRLWGMVHDQDDDFSRITGVDTHTGDRFDMDLMPDCMRVYLRENACGNMIFRLYTNIQHSLDPGVTISDQNGFIF